MKLTAIIVDDEENSRKVLKNLLTNYFSEVEIIGEAANVEGAYRVIEKVTPQLVFLDIQLPRENGFSLLRKYDAIPFEVIFVTSYDSYAINAIKFSALDYLLKPVELSDLKEAIEKAKKKIFEKTNQSLQLNNLIDTVYSDKCIRKIAVHESGHVTLVDSEKIVSIEGDGSYCNIMTLNGERFILAKYIKDFESYLSETNCFVRIHKSCLLNLRHISKYSKGEPCILEMSNGYKFEISRRKKQEVLERLKGIIRSHE